MGCSLLPYFLFSFYEVWLSVNRVLLVEDSQIKEGVCNFLQALEAKHFWDREQ